METPNIIPETSWGTVGITLLSSYAIMAFLMACTMLITTFTSCGKTNVGSSFKIGAIIAIAPAIIYSLTMNDSFFRRPFSSVFERMGLSPERSGTFARTYMMLLILLPLVVYGIHSAEESACVASASEMSTFKAKMLKELQEKQEAEEKNEKKK